MAGSTGIYRKISQRPFQHAVRQRSFTRVVPPVVQEPGHLAAIRSLRKQLGRDTSEFFDYRSNQRFGRLVEHARHHDVGYLAAIRQQRKQLGNKRPEIDVRWQLTRRQFVFGVSAPAPGADIGWLVSFKTKRAYGHNLRR